MIDIQAEGEPEPIGTTANHPFWSEDRQDFIPAGDLQVGETLRTADGKLPQVTHIFPRDQVERVYNLEVDAAHVYHVSRGGVLVHNTYSSNQLGRLGETLAGIPRGAKPQIRSLTGTASRCFPDEVTKNYLKEVKSRKYVSLTNQLKDYMLYAKDKSKKFILQTRRNTQISGKIEDFAENLGISYEIIKGLR